MAATDPGVHHPAAIENADTRRPDLPIPVVTATHEPRTEGVHVTWFGHASCLVELDGIEVFGFDDARVAALPGLKAATGRIAASAKAMFSVFPAPLSF